MDFRVLGKVLVPAQVKATSRARVSHDRGWARLYTSLRRSREVWV